MSQENEVIEAVERQDVERLIELTDPKVEWHSFFADLGEDGVYQGHEGMRRWASDVSDALDLFTLHIDDTMAVGNAVVLVIGQLVFRGRGSGVEDRMPAGYMIKFRAGRVVLLRAFRDPNQVFEAVGRRE